MKAPVKAGGEATKNAKRFSRHASFVKREALRPEAFGLMIGSGSRVSLFERSSLVARVASSVVRLKPGFLPSQE